MQAYKISTAYAEKVLRRTKVALPLLITLAGVVSVLAVYIVSGYQFTGHSTIIGAIILVHVALLAACLQSYRANAAYFNSYTLTVTPEAISLQTAHKTTTIDTDKIAAIDTQPDQSVVVVSRTGRKQIIIPAGIADRNELLKTLLAIKPLTVGTTTQPPTLLRNAVILTTMVCSGVAAFTTSHTVLLISVAIMGGIVAGGSIYIITSPSSHPRLKLIAKIALVVMITIAVVLGYQRFA
jgi:hypothetical protein